MTVIISYNTYYHISHIRPLFLFYIIYCHTIIQKKNSVYYIQLFYFILFYIVSSAVILPTHSRKGTLTHIFGWVRADRGITKACN